MDSKSLSELMWAALRAEGDGVVATGHTGPLPDVRGELLIEGADLTVAAHNLGVSNGIKAFLTHLSQNGWRFVGPLDPAIYPPRDGDLGQAFAEWLLTPTAIEKADVQGGGNQLPRPGDVGFFHPSTLKQAVGMDLSDIKGVILKGSPGKATVRLAMIDDRVHLDGLPIKFSIAANQVRALSNYSDYPLELRFQVDGKTYIVAESLGRPHVDCLVWDFTDTLAPEDIDSGTTYHEPVECVKVPVDHDLLKWLVPDTDA